MKYTHLYLYEFRIILMLKELEILMIFITCKKKSFRLLVYLSMILKKTSAIINIRFECPKCSHGVRFRMRMGILIKLSICFIDMTLI